MLKAKTPIGIDIGSHTVKVCQMRRAGDQFELDRVGIADIYPNGEVPTGAEEQKQAKIDAIKRAMESGQIKARFSVSAVSGESIIVRYLQLPEMPEEELKKALQWEAEEYIPFRLSEVNIDSMILGRVDDAEHPKMDVLLVSAKKDLVNDHVEIIRGAGLEPRIIDVDSFAFLNCFELNHDPTVEDCVALVNIGGEVTSINIYGGRVSRFSRDVPIGGDTITNSIRSRLSCTLREAEDYKISIGASPVETAVSDSADTNSDEFGNALMDSIRGTVEEMSGDQGDDSPEAQVQRAIGSILGNLLSEVRRSIEFFENQYRSHNVSRIVLGGGTVSLPHLVENFEKELGLPIELIDPLRKVKLGSQLASSSQIETIRQQLGVGIGLCVRGMVA